MSSKSKEEILDNYCQVADTCVRVEDVITYTNAEKAMEEYAEQEAIAFAEWMDGNGFQCGLMTDEGIKLWYDDFQKGPFTTAEMYQRFKTQQP